MSSCLPWHWTSLDPHETTISNNFDGFWTFDLIWFRTGVVSSRDLLWLGGLKWDKLHAARFCFKVSSPNLPSWIDVVSPSLHAEHPFMIILKSVYTSIYIYTQYVYIHTYVYIYIYIYIYTYNMYTYIRMYIYIYMCIDIIFDNLWDQFFHPFGRWVFWTTISCVRSSRTSLHASQAPGA